MNICIPIVGLSLSEAVIRTYYERDKINFGTYIYSILFVNVLTISSLITITLIFGDKLYGVTRLPKELICIALLISFFTSINNTERGLYRCEKKNKLFGIIVISQSVLYFLTISALYLLHKLHLRSAVYVEVSVYFLFSLHGIWHLFKQYSIKFSIKKEYIITALHYSLPLVLNGIMAYVFALSDRYIINYQLGEKAVAIYSATFQLVSILQIFAMSFNTAWVHWIYESLTKHIALRKLVKIQIALLAGFLIIGIVFGIGLYKLLPLIVGAKYKAGLSLIGWFIGSNVLQAFYLIFSPVLQFYNRNWFLLVASVPAVIFSVVLNINFLKIYGLSFAAKINCFSWLIIFVVTLLSSINIIRNAYKQIVA